MSNVNIIVLDDAEAVPVRTLADRLRMHPVDVVKDLRRRGYTLGSIRGTAGHWTMALRRNDAERYLAERRLMTIPVLREGEAGGHDPARQPPGVGPFVGDVPRTGTPSASSMRLNGVHVVTATDKACGHEVNVDAVPKGRPAAPLQPLRRQTRLDSARRSSLSETRLWPISNPDRLFVRD